MATTTRRAMRMASLDGESTTWLADAAAGRSRREIAQLLKEAEARKAAAAAALKVR